MKKIFVTILTLATVVFQMQAIEDASFSIQLESDNNRTSVVTLNQAAVYTANEQNASEMLAQITNTTTAVNIYAIAPYGKMAIMGTNNLIGTYVGFTTNSRTNYTLTFGAVSGMQLYIYDYELNKLVPIVENGQYAFEAPASSTIDNRFQVISQMEPSICFNYNVLEINGHAGESLVVKKGETELVNLEALPLLYSKDLSDQKGRLVVTLNGKDFQIDANPDVTPAN